MRRDQNNEIAAIRRADRFEGLPEDAVKFLVGKAILKTYAPNQFVYLVGERPKYVYCVMSGRVRVSVTSSMGQEFVLTDLYPDSWLGEISLIEGKTRVLEASVLDESDILMVSAKVVNELAERYPILYKNLFTEYMHRTRQIYELLAGMLFYPLKARLAGRMLDLLDKHGEVGEQGIELDIHMSQLDFARMSMGSRQRVNKIFRGWVREGILVKQGNKYVVTNLVALKQETVLEDLE